PVRGNALVPKHRHGAVEPAPGRRSTRVLVDDIAPLRLVHRRDDRHAQVAATMPFDGLDQLAAGDCLVGDNEQMHQWTRTSSAVRSPLRTAWRAPECRTHTDSR